MVAESIVFFTPMRQVGCAIAASSVASRISASSRSQKGPPDAVTIKRATRSGGSPATHWNSALCSESTGRICAPLRAAVSKSSSPAATISSLLATATSMPRSTAANTASISSTVLVGGRKNQIGLRVQRDPHQTGWAILAEREDLHAEFLCLCAQQVAAFAGLVSPTTAKRSR